MTGAAGAAVSAEGFIEEEVSAASYERIGRLDIVGEGPGDGIETLALAKAKQAFLEQGAMTDGDSRPDRLLSGPGHDDQVEVEEDGRAEGNAERAVRTALGEAAHLHHLIGRLGGNRTPGDVLHEPQVEVTPGRDIVERGRDLAGVHVERGLAAGDRAVGAGHLFSDEPGVKSVANAELTIEIDTPKRAGKRVESVRQPVLWCRRDWLLDTVQLAFQRIVHVAWSSAAAGYEDGGG